MTSHAFDFDFDFDFAELTSKQRYKLLIVTLIPRPIARIKTLAQNGTPNSGSFSLFNILPHNPAIMSVGIEHKPDARPETPLPTSSSPGEFTVYISDHARVDRRQICSIKFPPDLEELSAAGLETALREQVRCPRITTTPAAVE